MPRSPDVVQFQCVMPPELRNDLDRAAVDLRVPGGETASLDRGEMSRRLFRWFLSLTMDERLRIVEGRAAGLAEELDADVPPNRGLSAIELPNPARRRSRAPKR